MYCQAHCNALTVSVVSFLNEESLKSGPCEFTGGLSKICSAVSEKEGDCSICVECRRHAFRCEVCCAGCCERRLATTSDEVTKHMSKLRACGLPPAVNERCQCWDASSGKVVASIYLTEISIRCIEGVGEILWG